MEEYANDFDDVYDRIDDDLSQENIQYGSDEAEEDNSHNADGSEEAPAPKPVKIKKPVANPRPKLNLELLQGPKGLLALNDLFKDFQFRGGGHEVDDYGNLIKKLEQWAYRLFPSNHFEDVLKKLESLGKKREVQVYLRKIRNGLVDNSDVVKNFDDEDGAGNEGQMEAETADDVFDELISQQIAQAQHSSFVTPSRNVAVNYGTPPSTGTRDRQTPSQSDLSDEQKARMERNKQMALERRLQKQQEKEQAGSPMELDP